MHTLCGEEDGADVGEICALQGVGGDQEVENAAVHEV